MQNSDGKILQGLSGFCVEKRGTKVIKWTKGKDSCPILKRSIEKQVHELEINNLYPIKPLAITKVSDGTLYYAAEMPYCPYPTGYEIKESEPLQSILLESLYNRTKKMNDGFKEICHSFLKEQVRLLRKKPHATQALFIVYKLEKLINSASDLYPYGYAHGDFGFANMFVSDKVYMIDFTESFIYSPLMDVVTLELSVLLNKNKVPIQRAIVKKILSEFNKYALQIEILKKLKLFEILCNTGNTQLLRFLDD